MYSVGKCLFCGVLQVVTEEGDPKDKLNFGKDI